MSISLGVALLSAAVAAADPDPFLRARQAAQAYRARDYAAAEAGYRSLALEFPGAPGASLGLGRSLARQGRVDEALGWMGKAADAGVGADANALKEAFGPAADAAEVRALLSRFRGNLAPVVRSTLAFRLAEKDLLPESVAYDPAGDTYYVGSLYKRKIVAVANGVARDFIPAKRDGLTSVLGMKVDARRRELWANACNGTSPVMQEPEPRTAGRTAVFRYELGTGRLLGKYEAGSGKEPLCFNDLVLGPEGDAFVTAGENGVFRVSREAGRLERFAPAPGLVLNGIAMSPDGGTLFLADHLRGVVLLDVASRSLRPLGTPPGVTLAAIDGLYAQGASLVGVQNGFADGPERVVQAFLGDDGSRVTCVEVLERGHPDYDVPTAGVVVGDDLVYVAGSQLNRQDEKGRPWPLDRLRESALLRLPLRRGCRAGSSAARIDLEAARAELLAAHDADRLAHFKADAALLASATGDSFLAVNGGRIETVTAEAQRRMFAQHFAGARYEEWDDLEPPVVRISDDGSMAWVISRLKVRRSSPDAQGVTRERSFVYAGIMTYERRAGRWIKVANVSTFEPEAS
jgi:hypothetical protein